MDDLILPDDSLLLLKGYPTGEVYARLVSQDGEQLGVSINGALQRVRVGVIVRRKTEDKGQVFDVSVVEVMNGVLHTPKVAPPAPKVKSRGRRKS